MEALLFFAANKIKLMRYILQFILCLLSYISVGQVDTTLHITDVTISSDRVPYLTREIAKDVRIISRQEIRATPTQTVAELLQYHAGIDVRRRGISGVQADISMRGGTFNQVLIMLNGVKMIDPQTGHHLMNIPLASADIERIEIIKGPAARRYGQNAFSGVINIITKLRETDEVDIDLGVTVSSFTSIDANASLRIPHRLYDQNFSASSSISKGYRHNTDYKVLSGYYNSKLRLNDITSIDIQAGHTDRKFGANGFYASPKFTEQYEEVATTFASMQSTLFVDKLHITPRISYRRNYDHYVFIRSNPAVYENMHTSNVWSGELNARYFSNIGISGIGIEWRNEDLVSNNLGEHNRTLWSGYLEHKAYLLDNHMVLSGGIFLNKYSNDKLRVYPGLDATYTSGSSTIYASINQANRIPTYTNLYYTSRSEQGNADLLPEYVTSYEVGYKYNRNRLQASANVFYSDVSNLIDWGKENIADEKWLALNIGKANTLGSELSLQYNASPFLLRGSYTLLDIQSDLENEDFVSRYALDHLKHQVSLSSQVNIYKNINLGAFYRYYDRVSEYIDGYGLLDGRLSYTYGSATVHLSVNNILDTQYRETEFVPLPGRWFSFGFQLR